MRNLSDEEIQDMLNQATPASDPGAEAPADHTELQAYRLLYEALETEPHDMTLPAGFARRVTYRVMPARERFPWLEAILTPILLITALAGLWVFLPADFIVLLSQTVDPFIDSFAHLWTQSRLDLALVAGLILILVDLIDQRLHRGNGAGQRNVSPA